MKLLFVALLLGTGKSFAATGTDETIHVTTPGQLEDLVDNLESSRINRLVITGTLNAADLIYLRSGAGRMAKIGTLDISGIRLQASDEPYSIVRTEKAPYNTLRYYIADKDSVATGYDESPAWVIHDTSYREVYGKRLEGLFIGVNSFTNLILPSCMNAADYNFADNTTVETINFAMPPTEVGMSAFYNCTALKSVNLATELDSIGAYAFQGTAVSSLGKCAPRRIGEYAFYESAIRTLDFSRVEDIGAYALYECRQFSGTLNLEKITEIPACVASRTSITSVKFSQNLISIDREAFIGCTKLTDVTLPVSLEFVGFNAFGAVPFETKLLNGSHSNGVYYIGNIAYRIDNDWAQTHTELRIKEGTTGISDELSRRGIFKKVILPSSLKRIGSYAFYDCEQLESVNLPEGLERIDDRAFGWCAVLDIGDLPETIKYIGSSAFEGCNNICEITLPERLEYVGERAFSSSALSVVRLNVPHLEGKYIVNQDCPGLSRLVIGPKVNYLSNTFNGSSLKKVESIAREDNIPFEMEEYCFTYSPNLKSVVLPQTTTSIPVSCFNECKSLVSITFIEPNISKGFKVGEGAFRSCSLLSAFELPLSTETIGEESFCDCTSLGSITLPDGLRSIGAKAFCRTALTSINWPSKLESLGGGVFEESLNGFDFTFPPALKSLKQAYEGTLYSIPALRNMLVRSIVLPAKWADQNVEFGDCVNLETIIFEPGAETINCNLSETKLKNIYIPDGVKAFEGNIAVGTGVEKLELVSLPAECARVTGRILGSSDNGYRTEIEKLEWRIPENYVYSGSTEGNIINGFSRCGLSDDIVIPEGVEELGRIAFSGNYFIMIDLPSTMKRIDSNSFSNSWLNCIICRAVEPVTIEGSHSYLWDYTTPIYGTIYVPAQSVEAYQALECWRYFRVEPMTPEMESDVKMITNEHGDFAETEVYNLMGNKVATSTGNLPAGIYIVRHGDKTTKVFIR